MAITDLEMSLCNVYGGLLEGRGGGIQIKIVKNDKREVSSPSGGCGGCEMQRDLPQRFPIYDVSGMKDGSSDHNACLFRGVWTLCSTFTLCAGRHRRFCDRQLGEVHSVCQMRWFNAAVIFVAFPALKYPINANPHLPRKKKEKKQPYDHFKNTIHCYLIIFRSFDHGFFLCE